MSQIVIMPQLGETVAEGKILAWFKSVGDEVKEGDNLFEVETDKVSLEVQSIVAGRLDEIRVGTGVVAKVGEVVAVVGGADAARPGEVPTLQTKAGPLRSPFEEVATPLGRFGPAKAPDGVRATPLARRLIAQNQLDISRLANEVRRQGGDRIDEKVVRAALATALSPAPAAVLATSPEARPLGAEGAVVTLNAVRLRTGERLAENWRAIPHVFQAIEIDFTALDRVRRQRRKRSARQTAGR